MRVQTSKSLFLLHKLSGALIGLYGLVLLMLFTFTLFWNNKGASSMWEKSTMDWLLVIWLAVSVSVIFYGARICMFSKRRTYHPLLLVGGVLLVNIILLVARSSGEAVMYLSVPHLIAGVGVILWFGALINERSQ